MQGAWASLTEHKELEVLLGSPGLVLRPARVEPRITFLDVGKVEGLGPTQEVAAVHLGDLGRRSHRTCE